VDEKSGRASARECAVENRGRRQRREVPGALAVTSAPDDRQWCTRPPSRKRKRGPRAGEIQVAERVSGQCQSLVTDRTKPVLAWAPPRLAI